MYIAICIYIYVSLSLSPPKPQSVPEKGERGGRESITQPVWNATMHACEPFSFRMQPGTLANSDETMDILNTIMSGLLNNIQECNPATKAVLVLCQWGKEKLV